MSRLAAELPANAIGTSWRGLKLAELYRVRGTGGQVLGKTRRGALESWESGPGTKIRTMKLSGLILANATIVEAAGRRDGMHVRLDGERIAEVSDKPLTGVPKDAPIRDLKGKSLLPGLIDCHVHAMALTADLTRLERLPVSFVAAHAGKIL